jgi:hypothetical protein
MRDGVERSGVFLLFLSEGVMSRPFVHLEVREALRLNKTIILVHEQDTRFHRVDFGKELDEAPDDLKHLFDTYESIAFRTYAHAHSTLFVNDGSTACLYLYLGARVQIRAHVASYTSILQLRYFVAMRAYPSCSCPHMLSVDVCYDNRPACIRTTGNAPRDYEEGRRRARPPLFQALQSSRCKLVTSEDCTN